MKIFSEPLRVKYFAIRLSITGFKCFHFIILIKIPEDQINFTICSTMNKHNKSKNFELNLNVKFFDINLETTSE